MQEWVANPLGSIHKGYPIFENLPTQKLGILCGCPLIRQDEAKLRMFKLTSVLHYLPGVSPKQLYALAHL